MQALFEKIIEKLEEKQDIFLYDDSDYGEGKYNAFDEAIEIVKQEAEQCNNGWIPCSETPKEDGFYIVTLDGEIVGEDKPFSSIAEFENGKWVDDEEDYQCVLAWQPLPQPFQKGE